MAKKKTKIFFATDVHGSEVVFKKFLNAGKVYKVDVLILGGDLTGKMIVPLVKQPDGSYVGKLYGTTYVAKTEEELKRVEGIIKSSGYYPYRTTPEEVEELRANKEKLNKLFEKVALDTLKYWTELAEERLKEINEFLQRMSKEFPEQAKALMLFIRRVEEKGYLDTKTKELISVALGVAKHCQWCIAFHAKNALDAGAKPEEIIEAGWVAALMDGGPGLMYMIPLVKFVDELSKK